MILRSGFVNVTTLAELDTGAEASFSVYLPSIDL